VRYVKAKKEREIRRSSRDPFYFLTKHARTLDTHDKEHPIKHFPEKQYIKAMVDAWLDNPVLFIMKSRQIMATWTFVGLNIWSAMFGGNELIFFQSKREEDAVGEEVAATGLLGRARFLIAHLPPWMMPQVEGPYNKLAFPKTNSLIWAVPQGGDILRSHTASSVLSDEATSQPEFPEAYTGSRPTITGGGRFTALSSVKGRDPFWQYCYGKVR